jgi:tRNA(fMet)-specific endonuclease VapC
MILVDTTFLVDLIRKKIKLNPKLDEEILFTSEITVFELYFGLYSNKILDENPEKLEDRLDTLEKLLVKFQILPFGRDEAIQTARILGKLKLTGKIVDFRDGMIAGTGLANGIHKLLTRNEDHFNRITEIQTITYSIHK